jgi:membrane-bound lytic murein transglycosylase F
VKKRYLAGAIAAATVGTAILLLGPDARESVPGSDYGDPAVRDLDVIRNDTLRVLVIEHHLTYQRSHGAESGLEFELLERIAKDLEVPMRAILVAHADSLLPMLQRGAGDVIAAQLGMKNPFDHWIIHTVPYRNVSPVFVTLRADHVLGINLGDGVAPDTAWVSAWSPFAPREKRFPGNDGKADLQGRTVFTDTAKYGDDPVINTALGRMRAAIISDAEAIHFAQRFPQLTFSEAFDVSVPLVFGLRSNARMLQRAIDQRLKDPQEKEAMAMLMSAYGNRIPEHGAMGAVPCTTDQHAEFPGYANDVRTNGSGRDWALLAAIAFQGARADSAALLVDVENPDGSIDTRSADPHLAEAQVRAAARYFMELDSLWTPLVPDAKQRLRFIAAAYVAGPGHVQDACNLAKRMQLDPERWEGSVERAITLLALPRFFSAPGTNNGPCRGEEVFVRVREMVCLYDHFYHATL